jgi:hypothetical protein
MYFLWVSSVTLYTKGTKKLINIIFLLVPLKFHILAVVYSNNFQNKAPEKPLLTPVPHMALYCVVYCAVSPT